MRISLFLSGSYRPLGLFLAALAILPHSSGQSAPEAVVAEPVVTDVGPHHRQWTRQQILQLSNGRTRTNFSSYVELQSGLHRLDANGRWIETDSGFDILPDGSGAVAHRGAHAVAIAANLNTRGAVTVQLPVGPDNPVPGRLVSHVLGLAWFDAASGRSQMFAQVQDSIGELHGTDTVLFPDAFAGAHASVRYVNRRDGFEQFVAIHEQVTPPEGFAPDTTRLEAWTEVLASPAPQITQHARAGMTDDSVDLNGMQLAPGRAFLIGEENVGTDIPVAKRWVTTADQRTFLVEAVRYLSAKRALDRLPAPRAAVNRPVGAPGAVNALARAEGFGGARPFPAAPKARPANSTDRFRTAAATSPLQRETAGVTAAVSTPSPLGGERAGVHCR